ncbi:MAG: GHMP kinase [Desulfurococcales archaeon]|nr:GHMP kinase [Desulfurococcales archaeon]
MECVEVSAPSHVHVGNIDIHGGLGRLYGTIGFALEEPRLRTRICSSRKGVRVSGSERAEFKRYLKLFAKRYKLDLKVEVLEEIPAHVGLGSTTPIALSIGYATALLSGDEPVLEEIAGLAGRSTISGLGFYTFKTGGFIVDGGFKPGSTRVPPLIFRTPLPRSLSIVYAVPARPVPRILELKAREDAILREMPSMDEEMAMRNARLLAMGILPAAAEGDWRGLGEYLYRLNKGLGEYWASRQGGIYCCSEVDEIIDYFIRGGAFCACQSSWGPTAYALVPSKRRDPLYHGLTKLLEKLGGGIHGVTSVDNDGARVVVRRG